MPPTATTPGTYEFSQKQFIEPLADYLVSIRGPESSDTIPFKQRPRPTDAASTDLVVTEYALPRGGARELYMLRGDRRFVWPHDVIMNDKYAYYTDHFSYVLGRLDLKTGEATEMPFPLPAGAGRTAVVADGRPGQPGGGAHELQFDRQGNVIVGMDNGTRQIRSEVRAVQELGGRPRHVRLGSRRQCLVPAAHQRRADQDRHQ